MKREDLKKGVFIVPNLITTANLFCGFLSMTFTLKGEILIAAWILVLAGFFDFLDGRVARLTNTQSQFGLEYDSLSDLTSFGMAPAIMVYQWSLFHFGRLGWAAAFLFFACGALRLARFNVQASSEVKKFQGIPIPCAAACLISYVIFHEYLFGIETQGSYFTLVMTYLVAVLMVSNVRYRSFKILDRSRRANFFFLVLLIGFIAIMASAPHIMMFVTAMGYLAMGLIEKLAESPKKIANFADFMWQYFHANPKELFRNRERRRSSKSATPTPELKVVGMENKEEQDGKS